MTALTAIIKEELEVFKMTFNGESASATVSSTGGKAKERGRSDTAYRWRSADYVVDLYVVWESDWLERKIRQYFRALKSHVRPFSLNGGASFVNSPDGTLGPDFHEQAYYGNNRQKLRQVKKL